MSFMMAGSADGSCAAISAAVRAVPAESAATNSLALGKRHSARTTSAEQSVKSVASRARRHCSGRPSAPGGGASEADRLPCRATASNTSDQAIMTSGVAHTVKATRPPGFSTRLHSASAACGRGTWFIPKLDTAAWNILSGYGRSSASPSITTISGCVFRATPTIAAEKSIHARPHHAPRQPPRDGQAHTQRQGHAGQERIRRLQATA